MSLQNHAKAVSNKTNRNENQAKLMQKKRTNHQCGDFKNTYRKLLITSHTLKIHPKTVTLRCKAKLTIHLGNIRCMKCNHKLSLYGSCTF